MPHVIAYKMNPLTAMILRRLVKTPFAHLANIMMDYEVVPEFIQEHCVVDDVSAELLALLEMPSNQRDQTDAFIKLREKMGSLEAPSKNAADYILRL